MTSKYLEPEVKHS